MALEGPQIATIVTSVVALVVSSTALLWSTLQLIHSYLGSAKGYSRINEEAMPGWFKFKRRVFHKAEFRFAVKYDTPVFIVCSVANDKFPMKNQTALIIDGGTGLQSKNAVRTIQKQGKKAEEGMMEDVCLTKHGEQVQLIPKVSDIEEGLHTVHNERATWMDLLAALVKMEYQSQKWEAVMRTPHSHQLPSFQERTLAVAIQRKTRNWDNMPSSITKPYATTTICHIMEMAAMLGLHWKEFDRAKDTFLAEGNGFVLKSTSVSELGTVFTFQLRGASKFEDNRIIPVDQVKDLAFGLVPTIYHVKNGVDGSRLTALSADEFKDLKYLQMGSPNELAETLTSLGCNTRVSELIRNNDTNQRHLYPLAFEVVGMLGQVLHVKNSFFRTIPNPTFYQWDVRYFNMSDALKAFIDTITKSDSNILGSENHYAPFDVLRNSAIDVKKALDRQSDAHRQHQNNYAQRLSALHEAIEACDGNLKQSEDTRHVLSKHIQIVLSCLNPSKQRTNTTGSNEGVENTDKDTDPVAASAFAKLNSVPRGKKETHLIKVYFEHVLKQINDTPDQRTKADDDRDTTIWCTLVFRSLCWLALHDFHKNDRQPKGKSELMGSRLPVYII
ncbi:hypothetical protein E8E14_009362 [Neopestalotiopsis sp. 37M]|nr:hypothetical protein E8E14_009362 [Neopestalotiopsis sp. 37M]